MGQTTLAAPAKISYEDFLKQTMGKHAEWVNGEIIEMPSVSLQHQNTGRFLLRLLSDYVEAHPLGVLLYEKFQMKLVSRPSGREPDIIFVSNANLSRLTPTYLDGPGDLVIEVLSPESISRDQVDKFSEYQRAGVAEYWIIDPMQQETHFYQLGGDGYYHAVPPGEDGIYHCPVLPGFWIRVDWLWQMPLPPLTQVRRELGLS